MHGSIDNKNFYLQMLITLKKPNLNLMNNVVLLSLNSKFLFSVHCFKIRNYCFSVHGLDEVPMSSVGRRVLSGLQRTSLQLARAGGHLLACLHLESRNLVNKTEFLGRNFPQN